MTNETFTIEKALQIQHEQLQEWKSVLTADAYETLCKWVTFRNEQGYQSAYDVCRGTDLGAIVANHCMRRKESYTGTLSIPDNN